MACLPTLGYNSSGRAGRRATAPMCNVIASWTLTRSLLSTSVASGSCAKDGAKFTASGTYTRHILERLNVRRKRNSWNLLGFLMVLVFVTVLGAGCERGVASAPAPPAPTVEVTPVIQKDVPVQGEWVGTLEGYVNAQISPQVSGYLIRQDYHQGSFVKKGQA